MDIQKKKLKQHLRTEECQFCKKSFSSERTLAAHLCVKKQRYNDRETIGARLGFRVFQRFYVLNVNQKTPKTVMDFIDSSYYAAFVKFARYLVDLKPLSVDDFIDYVITSGAKLTDWERPEIYEKYLADYTKKESPERAVERSILEMVSWSAASGKPYNTFFSEVSEVEATYLIRSGKISPWVLYLSESAETLFSRFNSEQGKMIAGIIDPDYWNAIFIKKKDDVRFVGKILSEAGL